MNQKHTLFPLLLVLYEIAIYLSNDAYLPALPEIADNLSTTLELTQLTLTTWFIGSTSVQLVLGPVSDRYGRRPVLFAGGVLFVLSSIFCAVATHINTLLIARFIQGIAIPAMIIPGYATIHELFDREKAIQTLAWMMSIILVAPSLGPLFGASLLYFTTWRVLFALLALWAGVTLCGLFFKMPETHPANKNHPIQPKLIVSQYGKILMNRRFIQRTLASCLLVGGIVAWLTAGPALVMEMFGYSPFAFGLFQLCIFGALILGTQSLKRFVDRYTLNTLITVGLTMSVFASLAALVLAIILPEYLPATIVGLMLFAGGTGLAFPSLNRIAIESSTAPMGLRVATFSTGTGLSSIVGSGIVTLFTPASLMLLPTVLLSFSGLALLLYLVSRKSPISDAQI